MDKKVNFYAGDASKTVDKKEDVLQFFLHENMGTTYTPNTSKCFNKYKKSIYGYEGTPCEEVCEDGCENCSRNFSYTFDSGVLTIEHGSAHSFFFVADEVITQLNVAGQTFNIAEPLNETIEDPDGNCDLLIQCYGNMLTLYRPCPDFLVIDNYLGKDKWIPVDYLNSTFGDTADYYTATSTNEINFVEQTYAGRSDWYKIENGVPYIFLEGEVHIVSPNGSTPKYLYTEDLEGEWEYLSKSEVDEKINDFGCSCVVSEEKKAYIPTITLPNKTLKIMETKSPIYGDVLSLQTVKDTTTQKTALLTIHEYGYTYNGNFYQWELNSNGDYGTDYPHGYIERRDNGVYVSEGLEFATNETCTNVFCEVENDGGTLETKQVCETHNVKAQIYKSESESVGDITVHFVLPKNTENRHEDYSCYPIYNNKPFNFLLEDAYVEEPYMTPYPVTLIRFSREYLDALEQEEEFVRYGEELKEHESSAVWNYENAREAVYNKPERLAFGTMGDGISASVNAEELIEQFNTLTELSETLGVSVGELETGLSALATDKDTVVQEVLSGVNSNLSTLGEEIENMKASVGELFASYISENYSAEVVADFIVATPALSDSFRTLIREATEYNMTEIISNGVSFKGDKGDQGEKGDRGEKGDGLTVSITDTVATFEEFQALPAGSKVILSNVYYEKVGDGADEYVSADFTTASIQLDEATITQNAVDTIVNGIDYELLATAMIDKFDVSLTEADETVVDVASIEANECGTKYVLENGTSLFIKIKGC